MLKNNHLLLALVASASLLGVQPALADTSQATTMQAQANTSNKLVTFYSRLFMINIKKMAQQVPELSQSQTSCISGLSDDVMRPAFAKAFTENMSAKALAKVTEIHTPAFESAFKKLAEASRLKSKTKPKLTDKEKAALKKARSSGLSEVSRIINRVDLKTASLGLFEQAIEEQCGIIKGTL